MTDSARCPTCRRDDCVRRTGTDETVTNERGGRQAGSPYFLRGLPPRAILRVARVLHDGALKYEPDPFGDLSKRNWLLISSDEHLEHLLTHAVQYLAGDDSEDHAGHIATRALFFLHQRLAEHPEWTP